MFVMEACVYAILGLALLKLVIVWRRKTWSREGATFESISTSDVVPTAALLAYRLACAAWIIYIQVRQLSILKTRRILIFYTTWNWMVLGVYFVLASLATWEALRKKQRKPTARQTHSLDVLREPRFATAVSGLFHLNCTTVLIVDTVFWTVLAPKLLAAPDTAKVDLYRRVFFSFTSYNQHIVNAFLIYGDLALNRVEYSFRNISIVGGFSLAYAAWGIAFHWVHGEWIYHFLDTKAPTAPLAYGCLYLAHWIFYGVFTAAWILSRRLPWRGARAIKVKT